MNQPDHSSPKPKKRRLTPQVDESRMQQQIHHIDQVLANFSDAPCVSPPGIDFWKQSPFNIDRVTQYYAPAGRANEFQALYRTLRGSLVERETHNNASALLQGARGSGKSLVLHRCLTAFEHELQAIEKPMYRLVSLHGIAIPGKHVSTVLTEILVQLSKLAFQEQQQQQDESSATYDSLQELLRLKASSFTNNIQLLNEILEIAGVDGIPILFCLEELDSFLAMASYGGNHGNMTHQQEQRQILLYHLLDRVATEGSFVCFVGVTSDPSTVERLEKRIRSRAEGTSRFIEFGPCPTYEDVVDILASKCRLRDDNNVISSSVRNLLLGPDEKEETDRKRIHDTLRRDHNLGKDIRWFCRVLAYALSLLRADCMEKLDSLMTDAGATDEIPPQLSPKHILEAMVDMGASFLTETGGRDLVMVQGSLVDARLAVLCDLTGPAIVLLLASRRILARDCQKESSSGGASLTLFRILEEFRTSYKGSSGRYSQKLLIKAFRDLLELDIFRPASDHTGTLPFQYLHDDSFYYDVDINTMMRIPLHVTIDMRRELKKALDQNLLTCSTAIREWGRKLN